MSHWFLLVNGGSSIIHQQVESLSFRFREELGLPKMSAQIFFRRYLTTDFQATTALLIVGFIEVVTHTPFFASQPEGLKFRFPRATPAACKTYVRALPGVKSYVTWGLLWNKLSFIQKTIFCPRWLSTQGFISSYGLLVLAQPCKPVLWLLWHASLSP